ncbi:MAG: nitrite reductase, partial [Gammaproteobacteria bacterium]|nr:nitrite reductase [Gammaproteobacteria bacterium]
MMRQMVVLVVGLVFSISAFGAEKPSHEVSSPQDVYEGGSFAIPEVKMTLSPTGPKISEKEYQRSAQIFFERCAGCHGVLRKGATGKPLTPDITQARGKEYLKVLINYGTPAGMPNWGASGDMTTAEVDAMARFLMHEPPMPPEFGMKEIKASWNVIVPPEKRPTKKQHGYDTDNMFSVTLRDAGQVAIIDGDSKDILSVVDTGYAV